MPVLTVALFWASVTVVVSTYVVIPALVLLRGAVARRPIRAGDITPSVAVIIAARNEAQAIGAKLDSLLDLDYPPELVEIVVASDGSSDETEAIARGYASRRVKLLTLPPDGKAAALNAAVAASASELLVFSDANSTFARTSLRALVRPFADPSVGGVAGNQVYSDRPGDAVGEGERRYWDLDRRLKQAESAAGSTVSATGSIYAIRRSLFVPVPVGVTDDFVTSTRVVAQGFRLVFEPEAVAFEPVAESAGLEFSRKVRVMTRGLRGVQVMSQLLSVRRYGMYAVQLAWHKILRRMMAVPLLLIAVVTPFVWARGSFYKAAALAQGAFYLLALAGILLGRTAVGRRTVFSLPAYVALVNVASLVALVNVVRGRRIDRWDPVRGGALQHPAPRRES